MAAFCPVVFALALVIGFWISGRFKRVVQPLRLELAEKGEALLTNEGIPPTIRDYVGMLLDTAFSMRASLLAALFILPSVAIAVLVKPNWLMEATRELWIEDPVKRAELDEIDGLHRRITFANHPIISTLILAELAAVAPLLAAGMMLRGFAPPKADLETMLVVYWRQKRNFHTTYLTPA